MLFRHWLPENHDNRQAYQSAGIGFGLGFGLGIVYFQHNLIAVECCEDSA